MDAIRISATDIDAFRRFRDEEDAQLSDLLAQLRRQSPATDSMAAGTALHKALENSSDGDYAELAADGYTFTFNPDAEFELDLPKVREMKVTREYLIDGCEVTLVGKVDAMHGRRIDDHKFTASYDAERYLSSYQWRIYLDIFGADLFRWNIFEGRETAARHYVIRNFHRLTMHRYPNMRAEIEVQLQRFLDFARVHLPERFELPTVAKMLIV